MNVCCIPGCEGQGCYAGGDGKSYCSAHKSCGHYNPCNITGIAPASQLLEAEMGNKQLTKLYGERGRLKDNIGCLYESIRVIEQKILALEIEVAGLHVGSLVEGYCHADLKHPRWITGKVICFYISCGKASTTIECVDGKCRSFYLDSIRLPGESGPV